MSKAMLTGLLGGILLAWGLAGPARAAEGHSQAYAVIVGVGDYADKQIRPRPHAEADAKALYDVLADKQYLGISADHMRLLLGGADSKRQSEPATHDNVIRALQWAASKARRDDLVIVALFGEGAPVAERSCFFASDSTFKDRLKNAVTSTDVEHALEKLQSQKFCVFLDVNYKGFDTGKDAAPDINVQTFYQMKEFLGSDEAPPPGRVVYLATRGITPSLDLADHDAFTTLLLKGLKGAADREGYEADGTVTVDELSAYLEKELPLLTAQHGKTREERQQQVIVLEEEPTHFVLTHNPEAAAKARERLEKFAGLAKSESLSDKVVEEGRQLLERMPKLEVYRSLRKKYQELVDGKIDADQFSKARSRILDDMKMSRTEAMAFAAKVIQATEIIAAGYVKEVNQGELVSWGIKGLYQRIEEKPPQDIKNRLDEAKDAKESDLTVLLADVRQQLGHRDDLDNHHDIDFTLKQMLKHLDPYTTYVDPESLQRFRIDTQGNFTGIGVQIRKDTTRDMLVVVSPIKDSPAYKAGLLEGDVITTIRRTVDRNGRPLPEPEVTFTKGMDINDAVKKIQGKPGTKIGITIERPGVSHPMEFEITRALVETETVLGVKRNEDNSWDFVIDPENRIAYARLYSFADNTAADLDRALKELRRSGGIKGFILDLRNNPGGLLGSAVQISDFFIDDGLIVTIRNRAGRENAYNGESEGSLLDFPMVCLINGGSASGSEIVAACLQDHHRAMLMGERSYGKGSVQNLLNFEGGKLKLTTASYWRPSGKNIHRFPGSKETDEWGVTPDKVIKLSPREREGLLEQERDQEIIHRRDLPNKEERPKFEDRQLKAALEYLRAEIKTASRVQGDRDR